MFYSGANMIPELDTTNTTFFSMPALEESKHISFILFHKTSQISQMSRFMPTFDTWCYGHSLAATQKVLGYSMPKQCLRG